MAALAAATLAGAVLSATGWRLGQPLLYGAASGYFFLTLLVPLTGWVFVPAGVLAIFGAGMPRVNAPVVVASMMVPWAVIAVGWPRRGSWDRPQRTSRSTWRARPRRDSAARSSPASLSRQPLRDFDQTFREETIARSSKVRERPPAVRG